MHHSSAASALAMHPASVPLVPKEVVARTLGMFLLVSCQMRRSRLSSSLCQRKPTQGCCFSLVLQGVIFMQAWRYFVRFSRKDKTWVQALVRVVLLLFTNSASACS